MNLEEFGDLCLVAHVRLQEVGCAAFSADFGGALLAVVLVVGDDDPRAAGRAELRRGRADSLRAAGDEDDIPLQICCHYSSCRACQRLLQSHCPV